MDAGFKYITAMEKHTSKNCSSEELCTAKYILQVRVHIYIFPLITQVRPWLVLL